MPKAKTPSTIPYHDIHLSSYLAYRGVEPVLVKGGTRVVFHFPNDSQTHRLIAEFNTNPTLPVLDFIKHLRKLRAQMLSMRNE